VNRSLVAGLAGALPVVLAACGSGAGSTTSNPGAPSPAPTPHAVSVKRFPGAGTVLVDAAGHPLYTPDQEARGKVLCAGACTSFWVPLGPGHAAPSGAPGVGRLAVIRRPDGTRQLTAGGRHLYTFVRDHPGQVTGDGFADAFGGRRFTWHAVRAGGTVAAGSATGSGGGGGGSYGY
jgi:predicted lipoprotein with Yx(FWY)xxD motif